MDVVRLLLALLIPWAGGYCWLAALERHFNRHPAHPARHLGYGLFLGLMGLYGLLAAQSALFDAITFWPTLAALALLTAAGAAALTRARPPRIPAARPAPPSQVSRCLFWVLISWLALHLALIAIEILWRPVFPWDAWQTWMYRARIWFESGAFQALDSPEMWARGQSTATFNAAGYGYPGFVSALAAWAATALGRWSETLVNVPTLFCGIALALAMYGHVREAEFPRWAGILASYLLISIPLVNTHLALAGQADIWLAGYAGIGFVSLLWGLARNDPWPLFVGFFFIGLGVLVKQEGLVWLLAAAATLLVTAHPRTTLLGVVLVSVLGAAAWLAGQYLPGLPLLGKIGIHDGQLYLPLIGSHAVEYFDVSGAYFTNFIKSSTWHLLWPILLLVLVVQPVLSGSDTRRANLAFLAVFVLTQLMIFALSEKGRWAEDWTAINRLPLQLSPALVFVIFLTAKELAGIPCAPKSRWRVLLAPALGLLVTLGGLAAFYYQATPGAQTAPATHELPPLRFAVGGGRSGNQQGSISRYDNGLGVLSSGRIYLDAGKYSILHVKTSGDNPGGRRLFWRRADDAENVHSLPLGPSGKRLINLGSTPQWRGTITEAGLLFHEGNGQAVEFSSMRLTTGSLTETLQLALQDWRTPSRWSQRSVNFVPAGTDSTPLSLPEVMALWLLATTCIAVLLHRWIPAPYLAVTACGLTGWFVLDLSWTANLSHQAAETVRYYRAHEADHLDIANDLALLEFSREVKQAIGTAKHPVLVTSTAAEQAFVTLRVKHHLLPTPAYATRDNTLESMPNLATELIVVLRKQQLAPGESPASSQEIARRVSRHMGRPFNVALEEEVGVLLIAR